MKKEKRVHYLQHVDFEGPGYIETWLSENGFDCTATKFYEPLFRLPTPDDIDALIIMGGPMSVYDTSAYTWMKAEKDFIKCCIEAEKPVLGICLGAQLIADVLGAKVYKAPQKEIGWFPVTADTGLIKKGSVSLEFERLFRSKPTVFHWHGDQFELPNGCCNLLDSPANSNQAFSVEDKIIALQFHLEVNASGLALMIEEGSGEINLDAPYVQSKSLLLEGRRHIKACNKLMSRILNVWLGN